MISNEALAFFMEQLPSADAKDDLIQEWKSILVVQRLEEDTLLLPPGSRAKGLWFVLGGIVSESFVEDGELCLCHLYQRGNMVISLAGHIRGLEQRSVLTAHAGTTLLCAEAADLERLIVRNPKIAEQLCRIVLDRPDASLELLKLRNLTVRDRIIAFYKRFPEVRTRQIYLSHLLIASYLNVSLNAFHKHYRQLQEEEIL